MTRATQSGRTPDVERSFSGALRRGRFHEPLDLRGVRSGVAPCARKIAGCRAARAVAEVPE
ncbi:hypothetical protein D0U02_08875 [Burkholderia pseudomallei]|nr:hypothetical protein BHT10_36100 [Burkholderia pseudomallei]AYE32849.1 hypothetical protein CNX72_32775 [Burkholderia pseudomallei]AYX33462.1 hypothetical protein EGY16_25105 [Burkholderia pseudomallei]MPT64528.1 hypothetical protein [Burkholderia pseudomallei]MPT72125.1 hypothetical protein [Burkholderia pseudomallei]